MLLLFSLSFLLLTQPSLLDLGCKGLHGIVDHIHYKKPQCFFPQTKEELWFFCTCSCALTRGTSWLCSGHLALHSCAPAWHQLLAKVHGQPWGGDSLPLHSKVSKKHSGNVKGVLLITHGNSGIQMPGWFWVRSIWLSLRQSWFPHCLHWVLAQDTTAKSEWCFLS